MHSVEPPIRTSQMKRTVPPASGFHGIVARVEGSGTRFMSDSKISRNPRTEEPSSFGTPASKESSLSVNAGTSTWLYPPNTSGVEQLDPPGLVGLELLQDCRHARPSLLGTLCGHSLPPGRPSETDYINILS